MSYPSFRTYLKTLRELVKRKNPGLARESIVLSHLCLHYGSHVGLSTRDMKTLLLAAHFKNLGAVTVSRQTFAQSFDNYGQIIGHVAGWFEESAKLAQLAGLPAVEAVLTQYYHRAIPQDSLAKVFQVLNTWVACHQDRGWRSAMSDRDALIVLRQRALFAWSDPAVVSCFVRLLPQSPQTIQDYLQEQTAGPQPRLNGLTQINPPQPVDA
jgi:hypothetical protein